MNSFQSDRRKQRSAPQSLNSPSTFAPAPPVAEHDAPVWQGQDITVAGHSLAHLSIHYPGEPQPAAMQLQKSERADSQGQPSQLEQAPEGRRENQTGLPDALKAGVERLSGYSLSDIRVHYNSAKPAEVNALAYTQGTEIHVGPGQEQHLAHEAWHVVQQKQGRVQPTMQTKGVAINDDVGLEGEADVMGTRAFQAKPLYPLMQAEVGGTWLPQNAGRATGQVITPVSSSSPVQRVGEAKASLKPVGASSTEVPDLPQAYVDQLNKAKATPTERQKALDDLLAYGPIKAVIEQPPPVTGPPLTVTVVYNNSKGGSNLADTQYKSTGTAADITITFYATVFDLYSPAAIYSTLRHELIHAAQRTQSPDDLATGAQEGDEYMFENNETKGAEAAVGKKTYKEIQAPLQEIETHVWEIQHATETGIDKDPAYLKATWDFIEDYTQQLVVNLPAANDKVINYWDGYVSRAAKQLQSLSKVKDDQGDKLAKKLEAARTIAVNKLKIPVAKKVGGLVGVTKKGP